MFAKLGATSWDIIFSKDYPIWGAANRDESKDAVTVSVPVSKDTEVLESLSMMFEEKGNDLVHLLIGWDTTCLLYTSPSPRDRTRSRMPSSA